MCASGMQDVRDIRNHDRVWWFISVISALRRLRQDILHYTVRLVSRNHDVSRAHSVSFSVQSGPGSTQALVPEKTS